MGRKKRPLNILAKERIEKTQRESDGSRKAKRQRVSSGPAPAQRPLSRAAPPPARPAHQLRPTSATHQQAAFAIGRLLLADASKRRGATLKSLTLAPHVTAKRAVYAVTCETLKHLPVLLPILDRTQLLERAPGLPQALGLVLAYEALFGEALRPTGQAERAVLGRKADLAAALAELLEERGAGGVAELLQPEAAPRPRSARVNTLKLSVAQALAWMRAPPAEHAEKWGPVGARAEVDPLLPDVLLFPPGTDLHDHPLVAGRQLVLQSKASCMPAHALAPPPGWHVIDACAAPGNKTTHLAARMQDRGRVSAFDRDARRLERLRGNADACGATCIAAACADFLSLDPGDPAYADVRAILLDPSCSGSGTAASRGDHLMPSAAGRPTGSAAVSFCDERVEAVASFQEAALRHALRFPAAARVAYSTCSVHARENEGVVAAVLGEAEAGGWALEDPFPAWRRRGVAGLVAGAEKLVRTDPDLDGTDGFFVALFVRAQPGGAEPGLERLSPCGKKKRRRQEQQQQQRETSAGEG